MAPDEKSKAIKGLVLAAVIGLPFVLIANMKLSPETIKSLQEARAPASEPSDQANSPDADQPTEAEKIANGTHCVDGWDGTFPPLKKAVKEQLRNPSSFEHISTNWSHIGKDGKFGLVMKYRAQNGFGGMNVDAVGALIDARTCDFEEVSAETLAKRAMDDPTTS